MTEYIVVFRSLRLANYFFDSLINHLSKRLIDFRCFKNGATKLIKLVSPAKKATLMTIEITTESKYYDTRCRGCRATVVEGLLALDKLDELEANGGN